MLTFDRDHKRFNIRVCAVALHKRLLLTERDSRFDFFVVPGGRGEFHESTRSTLAREILEELGVPAQIGRLLWVVENFFRHEGLDYHELGFYYEAQFPLKAPYWLILAV